MGDGPQSEITIYEGEGARGVTTKVRHANVALRFDAAGLPVSAPTQGLPCHEVNDLEPVMFPDTLCFIVRYGIKSRALFA